MSRPAVTGQCLVSFAFDIGFATNLERCQSLLESAQWKHVTRSLRRSPSFLGGWPKSLSLELPVEPIAIGEFCTESRLATWLFDFGAVSVTFSLPLSCSLQALVPLSDALYENERLLFTARGHVQSLLEQISPAVTSAHLAKTFEDYCVYWVREPHYSLIPIGAEERQIVAAILRSENEKLSEQEVSDALQNHLTYTQNDCVYLDWNGALVVGREMGDVVALLEFANVELLELAFLDSRLREFGERAYDLLQTRKIAGADLDLVRRFQIDATDLLADINNPLRLLGDYFLARVHKAAVRSFDLDAWLHSIEKRLEALSLIASQMDDHRKDTRSHRLEVLIAALIFIDLVLVTAEWWFR